MVAKFVVIFSLAVAASAVPLVPITKVAYAEPEAPAQYEFSYSVHDTQTGDIKQQQESRNGDAVQGSYSLVQPDGVHRIVDYTSDHEHGFNAVVRYEGTPIQAPAPAKIAYAAPVAKVAYAAPVTKYAYAPSPITYAAPVAKVAYDAPVTKYAYAPSPITYAAPVAKVAYAAPVTKYAYAPSPITYAAPVAKVAYAAPAAHVTYSSPIISYQH